MTGAQLPGGIQSFTIYATSPPTRGPTRKPTQGVVVITDLATNIINDPVNGGVTLNGQVQGESGSTLTYYYAISTDSSLTTGVTTVGNSSLTATGGVQSTASVAVTGLAPGAVALS